MVAIWAVLVAVTLVSWFLGAGPASGTAVSALILVLAFVKVGLVGLYFMELRAAPLILRAMFGGYCLIACAVLVGIVVLLDG